MKLRALIGIFVLVGAVLALITDGLKQPEGIPMYLILIGGAGVLVWSGTRVRKNE